MSNRIFQVYACVVSVYLGATDLAAAVEPPAIIELESDDQKAPADEYSNLMERFIEALRAGNENEIRSMLSPIMLTRTEKQLGANAIDTIITDRFIPFFADFASLESTMNSVKTKDADGNEGLAFFRTFVSKEGIEKPFVVYVLNERGRLVIGNLVLNKTMSDLGLNKEAS